jgi:hypothetical protein
MSKEALERVQKHLRSSNNNWPRDHFMMSEKVATWLEHRLARVVGDSEVQFVSSTVEDGRARYSATILTDELVIHGEIQAPEDSGRAPYPHQGDVTVVHRSKIQSLTLHHVEPADDEGTPDDVSFTAAFDGVPPIVVGMPRYPSQMDGSTSKAFDSLMRDLGRASR